MKVKWEVDDHTTVEAEIRYFGKHRLIVNGTAIPAQISKRPFPFDLPDGRHASISLQPQFMGATIVKLTVDDQLMVPSGTAVACQSCGAQVQPNDRFCGSCGQKMPPAEHYIHRMQLRGAAGTIWTLAALFAISGIVMSLLARSKAAPTLEKLDAGDPQAEYLVNGATMTASALRHLINWQVWSVLIVNLVLAAIMVGLAIWGRRAPLAAILVATAVYVAVTATNAVLDPATIAQGIIVKILIILVLVRGIRGALAMRPANA